MAEDSNAKVIAHLARLGHLYFLLNDYRRADAFMKAMASIKTLEDDIAEVAPELLTHHRKLQFIGPSTIGEILDCLQRGTSDRLERLEAEIGNHPEQPPSNDTTARTYVTDAGKIVWGALS